MKGRKIALSPDHNEMQFVMCNARVRNKKKNDRLNSDKAR